MTKRQLVKWLEAKQSDAKAEVEIQYATAEKAYFAQRDEALKIMCIRYHMGAFCDKSEWNDYTRAVHKYTNVLWTHQADMLASHVEGV